VALRTRSNGCWITIHGGHETILTEDIGTVDRTRETEFFAWSHRA
jgi:hypothetical protein